MARFAISGLVVLVGIVLATAGISQDLGQRQAVNEARQIARLTGIGIVQPLVDSEVLQGRPAALDTLNDVVREAVIAGSLVRVKLWTADGRVIYSDEGRLIGQRFPEDQDRQEAAATGQIIAEISDLSAPENRFERDGGELLEVYVPLVATDGTQVVYETYFRLDGVRSAGRRAWLAFAPVIIGALVLLQLVQIPFAWSLARQIKQDAVQREDLLQRALRASEIERRRIAADLHDGVVQDLSGVSYSLSAAAAATVGTDAADQVAACARDIRASVRQLRSLLVDIYPPDLAREGLAGVLEDLLAGHRTQGRNVSLTVDDALDLPASQLALLYRIAQEALRNITKHAQADRVTVAVNAVDGGVRLRVDDDGRGFDVTSLESEKDHFGLRILTDAAAELGGRLVLRSAPGHGTEIDLWIPAP